MPAYGRLSLIAIAVALGTCLGASAGVLNAQLPAAPEPQPAVAQAQIAEAGKLLDAGDPAAAAALLKPYLETRKGSAEAHQLLAVAYLRLDDPRHSLEQYTLAAAIEKPHPIDLQNVAKDYVLLGDNASAEHWIEVALQKDDRDPESWYMLGRLHYSNQRFAESATCFQRSLALLPQSVKAEDNLGLAYEGLNRLDDAIAAYRQAIAWQQGQPHASEQPLLNLGIVLLHQGKFPEACDLLLQAVAIAPKDPRIHEQLGSLYLKLNELSDAERELGTAVALQPKKAALHFLLGKVYHLQGKDKKAKAEFSTASTISGEKSAPDFF